MRRIASWNTLPEGISDGVDLRSLVGRDPRWQKAGDSRCRYDQKDRNNDHRLN